MPAFVTTLERCWPSLVRAWLTLVRIRPSSGRARPGSLATHPPQGSKSWTGARSASCTEQRPLRSAANQGRLSIDQNWREFGHIVCAGLVADRSGAKPTQVLWTQVDFVPELDRARAGHAQPNSFESGPNSTPQVLGAASTERGQSWPGSDQMWAGPYHHRLVVLPNPLEWGRTFPNSTRFRPKHVWQFTDSSQIRPNIGTAFDRR